MDSPEPVVNATITPMYGHAASTPTDARISSHEVAAISYVNYELLQHALDLFLVPERCLRTGLTSSVSPSVMDCTSCRIFS